jgi:MOSC domain-containing protein YiiM
MRLTSVNIGKKEFLEFGGHRELTGIIKTPVGEPVWIGLLGLQGDFIASKKHHGGLDQAVYLYGESDYQWWSHELRRDLVPGIFGENFTVSNLESARFSIGDRLTVGEAILEVTAARIPCATFARRMHDNQFVDRFREAERPGLYCRVLRVGSVQTGDDVICEPYRKETVTIVDSFRSFYESDLSEETLRRFLSAPLASRARASFEEKLEKLLGKVQAGGK